MDASKVTVIAPDGKTFSLSRKAALKSDFLRGMLEDVGEGPLPEAIPLQAVDSSVMQKVIDFLEHHADQDLPQIERPLRTNVEDVVPQWDREYLAMSDDELFKVIAAANYLAAQSLMDLTCAKVATIIKGKTPEEIRQRFNIENDFTPEEEAKIREEYRWAFQS
jgi:S-phase kinase-associated protein 1